MVFKLRFNFFHLFGLLVKNFENFLIFDFILGIFIFVIIHPNQYFMILCLSISQSPNFNLNNNIIFKVDSTLSLNNKDNYSSTQSVLTSSTIPRLAAARPTLALFPTIAMWINHSLIMYSRLIASRKKLRKSLWEIYEGYTSSTMSSSTFSILFISLIP